MFFCASLCVSEDKWSWQVVLHLRGTWAPRVSRLNYFLSAGNRYGAHSAGGLCYWIYSHWISIVIKKSAPPTLACFFFCFFLPLSRLWHFLFYFSKRLREIILTMSVFVVFTLSLVYVKRKKKKKTCSARNTQSANGKYFRSTIYKRPWLKRDISFVFTATCVTSCNTFMATTAASSLEAENLTEKLVAVSTGSACWRYVRCFCSTVAALQSTSRLLSTSVPCVSSNTNFPLNVVLLFCRLTTNIQRDGC